MSNTPGKKTMRRMSARALEALLDGIKDRIDTLAQIAHEKQRDEAADDLVEYIELHFHS